MSRDLLLLESIKGHLELLARKHPRKAATPIARKVKRYVDNCLRQVGQVATGGRVHPAH